MPPFLKLYIAVFALGLLTAAGGCTNEAAPGPEPEPGVEIRGVYGSPVAFWDRGLRLDALGANAVFVRHQSLTPEIVARARAESLRVLAEFATLNGKGYVEEHPEAWAIDERGERVEAASWFMGVCPTEPGFRTYRLKTLRELLQRFDLDGVWMDYLHWHAQFEEPEPILPETCFCDRCLTTFQASTGIEVPEGTTAERAGWILANRDPEWRTWRASVIAGWVRDFRTVLEQESPGALLGVYHCPWDDDEFDGARRRILGLDYDMLRGLADVFSPMVYHGRMGRSPEWVEENIAWFSRRLDVRGGGSPKIWPIVQAYDGDGEVSAEEFERVLRYGASAEATGVMMFTSAAVAQDSAKTEAMRRVYRAWAGE